MSAPVAADSPITIKVNHNGTPRRFKLPLRDMVPSTLEPKLRALLELSSDEPYAFERYSDSASSYVALDPANTSVYKQLYRAAKAKSKLKIRATPIEEPAEGPAEEPVEEKSKPKPVTVEDEKEEPELEEPAVAEPAQEPAPQLPESIEPVRNPFTPDDFFLRTAFRPTPFDPAEIAEDFERCLALCSPVQSNIIPLIPMASDMSMPCPIQSSLMAADQLDDAESRTPTSDLTSDETPDVTKFHPCIEFRVCCNNCDATVNDTHYHCSKCDDDDFDLCQSCVDRGVTCYSSDHWLIKRFKQDGLFISSTTQTIAPKAKLEKRVAYNGPPQTSLERFIEKVELPMRTCNSCVKEFSESKFVHCLNCEDYDLCLDCFAKNAHGHHPGHSFECVSPAYQMSAAVTARLAPGRNQSHNAICDGCDKHIVGVRRKCLDCPDWDFCSDCFANASFIHAGHRFVPIYEPLADASSKFLNRSVHHGICCDGPLCSMRSRPATYITGVRYKCAICNDTDFCASCESSPANMHNKTHPLIKFKTPVRHVSISTTGEHGDGKLMAAMGDRLERHSTSSRSTETVTPGHMSINSVQTVVDMEPTESCVTGREAAMETEAKAEEAREKEADGEAEKEEEPVAQQEEVKPVPATNDLVAVYIRDTIQDGSVLPPNHVFEQTWVLRNMGSVSWPAGCSVRFVGGDYMGHVDSSHPAEVSELESASESTVCERSVAPGEEVPFTVLLRTPMCEGHIISYWRLTSNDGTKFGHRLWCDVVVQAPKAVQVTAPPAAPEEVVKAEEEEDAPSAEASQMIFPKLEKESPVSSIHHTTPEPASPILKTERDVEAFEDVDDWDASDDGFLTDEEYDILDASDEEYLGEQRSSLSKK